MELLRTVCLLLAALCTCALGQDEISNTTVSANVSASTPKTEEEALNTTTLRATTLLATKLTATTASTMTVSITTSYNTTTPANATESSTTQHTAVQQPAQATPTARTESGNTTSAVQVNGTQSAQNESATTTKAGNLSPTTSLQENTTAPGTSDLSVSTLPIPTDSGSTGNSSKKTKALEDTIHYSSVILPIVIALIVITLSAFSLVALYRVCHKKTPDRQENGTEQAQSDKEGVKLLSVKTTSAETGRKPGSCFIEKLSPTIKELEQFQTKINKQMQHWRMREKVKVFVEARDIFEVGFSLPSANLSELTAPPPAGEAPQSRQDCRREFISGEE